MYPEIQKFIAEREKEFSQIPEDRKLILRGISTYIQKRTDSKKTTQLVYICIHNSRRSHFGHIAAEVSANYFQLNLTSFSGGTEATAFNPNAIHALISLGFKITTSDKTNNPVHKVQFDDLNGIECFSKVYDHPTNPKSDFAVVMTCSEAEENCPFIPNAEFKTSTPYEDPKLSDGSGNEMKVYTERFTQILRETIYAFSLVKK